MQRLTVLALSGLLTLGGATLASADVMKETTTRSETTTYSGTVSAFAPGSSTIVLKSETSPEARYQVTEKTTYVDAQGNVVSRESIMNQPVTIHTTQDGDKMVVSKVVVSRPGTERTVHEKTIERRSTETDE